MAGSFTMASLPTSTLGQENTSFVSGADQNEINYYPSWKTRSFEYASWKPTSEGEGEGSQPEGFSSSEVIPQGPVAMDMLSKDEVFHQQLLPASPHLGAKQADMNITAPDYSSMAQMQVQGGQYYVPMMMMPMMQPTMMSSPIMTPLQAPMMQQAPMMVMPMAQQYPSDAIANISPMPRNETRATSNTTVMWRNIPNNYSRDNLLALIDSHGFAGSYDFFYAPLDFSSNALVGYAFVNFVDTAEADRFFCHFQGFTEWSLKSTKKSQVTWSQPLQGLQGHIERYRNSAVMHPDVSDDKKPALFNQGQRVDFPMPTKTIRAPHLKECRPRGE